MCGCYGVALPVMAAMPFTQLGLNAAILQAVQDAGYTEPTPIQAAAIPAIINGDDVIGIAQTGTGKTAAFTLPILNQLAATPRAAGERRRTRVLVIAPTRELVAQIEENVLAYARHVPVKIARVFGGVGEQPQKIALRDGCDIVIACPGRLLDLMRQGFGDFSQITHLVLDEADRMLDMGFLPDIRRIVDKLPKKRQTLLFSATLSREIEQLTKDFQRHPKIVQIGKRSNPAETVTQMVYEVSVPLKVELLKHLLLRDEALQMVIVFTRTKHGADKVARKLEQVGIKCGTLHANRSQNQRMKALADFKAWKLRVLVCTDIAARGIDVDGISHVVNFDFPPQPEDYVHRIGRTGRAQAIGDAISFVTPEDYGSLRSLERFIGRGLVRKRADDFDYNAKPPAAPDRPSDQRRDAGAQGAARGSRQPSARPQRSRRPGGGDRGRRPATSDSNAGKGATGGSASAAKPERRWGDKAREVFGKIRRGLGGGGQ